MDNIQSIHKWLHLYLVILFLLFVSKILAFNLMLMSVKIRRYRVIIIIIIIIIIITESQRLQSTHLLIRGYTDTLGSTDP